MTISGVGGRLVDGVSMSLFRLVNSDGIDVLQRTMEFAGQRHALITHNISNLTTPNFQPVDVSPRSFQAAMQKAVEARREEHPGVQQMPLRPRDTREMTFHREGMTLHPRAAEHNIMFHDRNDRDLERMMQDLAENSMVYRQMSEMLRNRYALMTAAIRSKG